MFAKLLEQVAKVIQLYEKRGERPSEEATKHALVLPFIHDVLGAHYLDPEEVIPEFTADIGQRKGEKVDYAVCRDGEPIILIECKALCSALDNAATVQLERYVNSRLGVSLGILTDGRHYRFYADLDEPNILDAEPFLNIDLLELTLESQERLELFHKDHLDVGAIKEAGRGWKTVATIVRTLEAEWTEPSREYVEVFARRLHAGPVTELIRKQYTDFLKEAHDEFLNKRAGSDGSELEATRVGIIKEKQSEIERPRPSSWRTLPEWNSTDPAPEIVRFSDGTESKAGSWAAFFRAVTFKINDDGKFHPDTIPEDLNRLISKVDEDKMDRRLRLPYGLSILAYWNKKNCLNIPKRMLTAYGYNPADVYVK